MWHCGWVIQGTNCGRHNVCKKIFCFKIFRLISDCTTWKLRITEQTWGHWLNSVFTILLLSCGQPKHCRFWQSFRLVKIASGLCNARWAESWLVYWNAEYSSRLCFFKSWTCKILKYVHVRILLAMHRPKTQLLFSAWSQNPKKRS